MARTLRLYSSALALLLFTPLEHPHSMAAEQAQTIKALLKLFITDLCSLDFFNN
jgi:hypothetical protein